MRPSNSLELHRAALLDIAKHYGFTNVRVFGSVARGEDKEDSDIDLLVEAPAGTTLLTLARVKCQVEDIIGVPVDIHTLGSIHERIRANVLKDARAL